MCEPVDEKLNAWQGWLDVPRPRAQAGGGAWLDLSHPITESLSRSPMFPRPRIRRIMTLPALFVDRSRRLRHSDRTA